MPQCLSFDFVIRIKTMITFIIRQATIAGIFRIFRKLDKNKNEKSVSNNPSSGNLHVFSVIAILSL